MEQTATRVLESMEEWTVVAGRRHKIARDSNAISHARRVDKKIGLAENVRIRNI